MDKIQYNSETLTALICTGILQPLVDAIALAETRGQQGEGLTKTELERMKEAVRFLPSREGRYLLDHFIGDIDLDVALAALGLQ